MRSTTRSDVQRRIHAMETSLLYSNQREVPLSGGNGALVTKARVFGDALQNELNAMKKRQADSLRRRRNFNLIIDTEAAKLLKPTGNVVRLRKSNADAIDKLTALIGDLANTTQRPSDALPFSPIKIEGHRSKPGSKQPYLSPTQQVQLTEICHDKHAKVHTAMTGHRMRTLPSKRQVSLVKRSSQPKQKTCLQAESIGLLDGIGFFSDSTQKSRSPFRRSSSRISISSTDRVSATRRLSHSSSFCGIIGRNQSTRSPSPKSSLTLSHSDLRAERT